MRKLGRSLSYANVMATVAVFLALGGGAFAATKGLTTKGGAIHGCVSARTHVLTVLSPVSGAGEDTSRWRLTKRRPGSNRAGRAGRARRGRGRTRCHGRDRHRR